MPFSSRSREKNYHKGKFRPKQQEVKLESEDDSVVIRAFHGFRKELDYKHDKYERIVKLSRDITIESKRAIFGLQALCRSSDPKGEQDKLLNTLKKLITTQFRAIAKELEGEDPYQYLKAYSPGLQEFIEAITLYYYIQDNCLYNWDQLKKELVFEYDEFKPNSNSEEDNIPAEVVGTKTLTTLVPLSEYILGIQDLSGELMRLCINSFAAGYMDNGFLTCNFVKNLYTGMSCIGHTPIKELFRKQVVMKQSLLKMETACYMMHVRGSEILQHMFPDVVEERQESYEDDTFIF